MARIRDFENNISATQVLDPAVITTDTNCASVDTKDYESVAFYAMVGESGDTLGIGLLITLKIEVSDDNSTFAAPASGDITNEGTRGVFAVIDGADDDDAVYMTEYRGPKRYVRPVVDVTGTHTNGTPIAILAMRSGKNVNPV
jgi:hypothetical protein